MKKILLLFIAVILFGCVEKSTPQQISVKKSNEDYDVTLLFEVDSIRVYKFTDNGHTVYFSGSYGRIDYDYTSMVGKIVTRHTQTTLTN